MFNEQKQHKSCNYKNVAYFIYANKIKNYK